MTLDEVMKLIGDELDSAVAERLGRCPHPFDRLEKWVIEDGNDYESGLRCTKCGKGDIYGDQCPRYSTDWNAAMQVREWARGLIFAQQCQWLGAVEICMRMRLDRRLPNPSLLDLEAVDFARAALLVSP